MKSRKEVKGDSDGKVILYPARHFSSLLKEGQIMLAYGSNLDFKYQSQLFTAIAVQSHQGFFINIASHAVLALVHLNLENLLLVFDESISTREGTMVKLKWKQDNSTKQWAHSCTAMAILNIFGLPYSETIRAVVAKSVNYFKEVAVGINNKPKHISLKLSVKENTAGVRQQVDAINVLCKRINAERLLTYGTTPRVHVMSFFQRS